MDIESRLDLIKSEPLEEVITEPELRELLETHKTLKHYVGLEMSGMLHIGHVLFGGKKINDFAKAGIETQILLADWHTMANNKLGGDWERIKKVANFYREVFNVFCPNTKIILGSDLYRDNNEYWEMLMQIARRTTMARATRMLVIEGRSEKDTLHVSQYIYPIMQTADIWALGVDLPHAGIDQRRVHVFAKEAFKDLRLRKIVPLHHRLVPSLLEPPKLEGMSKEEKTIALKMSKSKPGSYISILATEEEIRNTLNKSWCPEGVAEDNPVLMLCQCLILPMKGTLHVERTREHGGSVDYSSFLDLSSDFKSKKLHPADLKSAVADLLIDILDPIRRRFSNNRDEILKLVSV